MSNANSAQCVLEKNCFYVEKTHLIHGIDSERHTIEGLIADDASKALEKNNVKA
jgi:hypothetical protein